MATGLPTAIDALGSSPRHCREDPVQPARSLRRLRRAQPEQLFESAPIPPVARKNDEAVEVSLAHEASENQAPLSCVVGNPCSLLGWKLETVREYIQLDKAVHRRPSASVDIVRNCFVHNNT